MGIHFENSQFRQKMDSAGFLFKTFVNPPWHLIAAAFIGASFYTLDAWVWFLPVISVAVLLLILPCLLIATTLCLFPTLRKYSLKAMGFMGILLLGVMAVVGTNHFHRKVTQCRASKLGEACQAYRAKYHHYPKRLVDLVPEFIASVPPATVGLLGEDEFVYSSRDGTEPFIYYNCLPPFGNCYYYVESRCWAFLD
jgi:hypothetical protein